MIGPHYQRLAQAERHITGRQMLQRIQNNSDNPLTMVIDKLKRQFSEYQTAYNEDITNHSISSVDRLLSFDGKLGPILAALQKQNNLLRRQLSLFQSQLSNSTSICQQLITQNNDLKQALLQKNSDLLKIIQTIGRNQSQQRNQLQDKIALLQQQNGILIQHLQEIKKKHIQFKTNFEIKDEQVKKYQKKWSQTKKQHNEAITRQRQLTRKLAISQHLLFQQKQKKQVLQNTYTQLLDQSNQLKAKLSHFQGTPQNDPHQIRRSIQNQYIQILQQHRILKTQRQNYLHEIQKLKLQKQKLQQIINQIQKKLTKILLQHQLSSNLLLQQKNKNQTIIAQYKQLQIKFDQIKQDNLKLNIQLSSNKQTTINRYKIYQSEIQQLRKQNDMIRKQMEKRLKDIIFSKDLQIKRLYQQNLQFKRKQQRL